MGGNKAWLQTEAKDFCDIMVLPLASFGRVFHLRLVLHLFSLRDSIRSKSSSTEGGRPKHLHARQTAYSTLSLMVGRKPPPQPEQTE